MYFNDRYIRSKFQETIYSQYQAYGDLQIDPT